MNFIDWLIILAVAMGAFWGFRNGFIKALLGFVAIGAAVFVGFRFSGLLEKTVSDTNLIPREWISVAAIIFTVILVYLIIKLMARIFTGLVNTVGLGIFNRLGGAVFGALINLVILAAIMSFLIPFVGTDTLAESNFYPVLSQIAEFLGVNFDLLKEQWSESELIQDI